jgi:hypothetical protein
MRATVPLTTTVERITPTKAQKYLEGNTNNRRAKFARIHRYAKDMADGNWRLTGESIKFNGDRLLDGQNRLLACVQAGVPFSTFVVRGLPDDVMEVLDSGAPRTVADALHISGALNSNTVAAMARLTLTWRGGEISNSDWWHKNLTPLMIIEFAEANLVNLDRAAKIASRVRHATGLVISATGTCLFEIINKDLGEEGEEFYDSIIEGAGLKKGDPRLALRNWASGKGRERRYSIDQLHANVTAWNAYVDGTPLTLIRPWFKTNPFPTLKTP